MFLMFINSIPFEGFPFLQLNGYEFHWNGYFWEYVGW